MFEVVDRLPLEAWEHDLVPLDRSNFIFSDSDIFTIFSILFLGFYRPSHNEHIPS